MTILITAIGSMSADTVIESLREKTNFFLIGCDIHPKPWVPASDFVDKFFQVPSTKDAISYLDELERVCLENKVSAIIPLTDPEVDVLTINRNRFEDVGIILMVASTKTTIICRDKLKLYEFFQNSEVISPIPTYRESDEAVQALKGALIAKPVNGRSSEGLLTFTNLEQYNSFLPWLKNYIIQPFLGGDIYTVDLVRNADTGRQVCVARRELLRTKNGAGISVEIVHSEELNSMVREVGKLLDIKGAINIEFIRHDGKFYLMDINPRFSAGIAFTRLAGYDIVNNHLRCFFGQQTEELQTLKTIVLNKKYITVERTNNNDATTMNHTLQVEGNWNNKWTNIFDHYQQDIRHAYYVRALLNIDETNVLELGAGSFRDMAALNNFGVSCEGCDFSTNSVRLAKEKFPSLADKIHQRDVFHTGFEDDQFDVTFHNGLWIYFSDEDIKKMAKEQARITRSRMMVTVHNGHNKDFFNYFERLKKDDDLYDVRFFDTEEIKSLMGSVCSKVTVIPVGKGKKMFEDHLINLGWGHAEVMKMVFDLAGLQNLEISERLLCIGEF